MTKLPHGWTWTTIGEVCEKPKYGWTTSASESGQIRLLRTTDLTRGPLTWESVPFCKETPKNFADFEVHKNDIFISRAGSVGVSVLVKEVPFASVFASYLIRLRPTNKVNAKFLALFLQSPHYWDQVLELSSGIALANINATKIQSMSLPLPPLLEQHKIVEILEDHLSRLDAALADVKQAKVKAAQFRRSLLQAAFTGNLGSDGTRLMTDIPSGWNRVTLNDLGNWVTGATPQSKDPLNFGDEVEFVTPSDIGYGGRLGVVERRISELGASRVRKLKAPSVNLVCIGTIGKVALANREVTTNQQINSLEPNESVVLPNFAMWLLASPEIQEALWQASSSTTVAILNKGNLCKIETSIPPLPEQHKIVEILEDHLSRLDASIALADAMEKQSAGLRRSLLQAAFTGQLTKEVASV